MTGRVCAASRFRTAAARARRSSTASRWSARCSSTRIARGVSRCRRRISSWGCNAAARTATRASRRIPRSARPSTGSCVTAAPAILSETPEVYGAEHLLTRRAVSREVGEKLLARIAWWQDYCERNGAALDNNPSAGNKVGGLTTILEKSLGAVAKGGTTNLVEVYEYAQPVTAKGFVFMDSPGYDPMSATGQVASGANLICFTTGRGSAYGCAPSPSLKLATNTALWERQEDDMDINCGGVIDGTASIDELGEAVFRMMLDCASGTPSKSELHGYGQNEFVPWQGGAVT